MERIKVGIIGQGRSGRDIHRHLLECVPDLQKRFEVVAVADPIRERCEAVNPGASPDCRMYSSYQELLEDRNVELVVNASRSHKHVEISLEALGKGYKVLSEKPLARLVSEAKKPFDAARKNGGFFTVFQQSRFRPVFRRTMDVIASGVLGRVVQVKLFYNGFSRRWDWQTVQGFCAGNLLNTGPHPLDQALQFYGDADPERVICFMDRCHLSGDAEDHVKILLSGKDHPVIDLEASAANCFNPYCYQVYGTLGCLAATAREVTWKYFRPGENDEKPLCKETLETAGRLPTYCEDPDILYYEEKCTIPEKESGFDWMGAQYYKTIFRAIREGKPLVVREEEILRQIAVIEECHKQNPFPQTIFIRKEEM